MSNQYPGQPGDLPPTQVAPGNVPQQPGPPAGYPQQPQQPYGAAPGGGYPPPGPPPFGAPPTGGGGGKKIGLIIGIIVAVLVIVGGGATAAIVLLSGDDDDDSADRPKVTATVTQSSSVPTDVTTPPTTDVTTPTEVSTPPTTDAGGVPTDDPTFTAQAYLDSLVTGDCLAVEGLSTPEWFSSEYGNQRGCKRESPNADMSQAQYDFEAPIENGDGSQTLIATITAPDVSFTGTWTIVPSDDGTVWLVDFFLLA